MESIRFVDNRVAGLETEVEVVVSGFYSDNSPRIDLVDAKTREHWVTCTVMMPESTLMENVVYVKDWSENEGMRALLAKNGVIERLPNGATNGVFMHRLMPEVVRMVNDARASLEAEAGKPDFNDFDQSYRYNVAVETRLVLALPITDFRPEAMRVTERMSTNGTWFEVETFNAKRNLWIEQKDHPTEAEAIADAKGWYPQPDFKVTENIFKPGVLMTVEFDFFRHALFEAGVRIDERVFSKLWNEMQKNSSTLISEHGAMALRRPSCVKPSDTGYFIRCEESNLGFLKSFGLEAGDYDHKRGGVMVGASKNVLAKIAEFPEDFKVEGIGYEPKDGGEKFYVGTLMERNGDRAYDHQFRFKTSGSPEAYLDKCASNFFEFGKGEKGSQGEKGYYFDAGCLYVEPKKYQEVDAALYGKLAAFIEWMPAEEGQRYESESPEF